MVFFLYDRFKGFWIENSKKVQSFNIAFEDNCVIKPEEALY